MKGADGPGGIKLRLLNLIGTQTREYKKNT